jgi:outer membrane protein assembly factor BamE (lipoprotein component of BamABCDE complex)
MHTESVYRSDRSTDSIDLGEYNMGRFPYTVIILFTVIALTGCQTDRQQAIESAKAYVAANPSLDREAAANISANRLEKGMTRDQVIAAWGKPIIVQHFNNNSEFWLFGCV